MSKLFNLKEWLTLHDAAKHLALVFGENVTEADVLQLGLLGKLTLSVDLVNHATATKGKFVSFEEVNWGKFSDYMSGRTFADIPEILEKEVGEIRRHINGIKIDDDKFFTGEESVSSISGIWDIPMIGGERLSVESQFRRLTGGPDITELLAIVGTLIERNGVVCRLKIYFENCEFALGSEAHQREILRKKNDGEIAADIAEKMMEKAAEARRQRLDSIRRKEDQDVLWWYQAERLPANSVLVVRTENITKFLGQILESDMPSSTLSSARSMTVEMPAKSILLSLDEWVTLLVERSSDKNRLSWQMYLENSLGNQKSGLVARDVVGIRMSHRPPFSETTCWLKSSEVGMCVTARGFDVLFENDVTESGKSRHALAVANESTAPEKPDVDMSSPSEPERRLARLRELGGDATYKKMVWKFSGIKALIDAETKDGKKGCSPKTVRSHLTSAAEAERQAKLAAPFDALKTS